MAMERYYKVHCTNCGAVWSSHQMAVNLDKILQDYLNDHLGGVVDDDSMLGTAKRVFQELQIGLYLTKSQMEEEQILDRNDTLCLTCQHILDFIGKKYAVDIGQIRERWESDDIEDDIELLDDDEEFDLDDPYKNAWEVDEEEDEYEEEPPIVEIPAYLLNTLSEKMQLYGHKKIDNAKEIKEEAIRDMLQTLYLNQERTLLKCRCSFLPQIDDRGQEYASTVKVLFADGATEAYNHFVCPDCGEEFFADAGKYQEYIIVMLGSSRVGKTAYLAALIDALKPEYGPQRYPVTIKDTIDRKYAYFIKRILKIYRSGRKILKTDEKKEVVALFSLDVKVADKKTVILTFVDMPGEVFIPKKEEEKTGEISGRFIINHRKICYRADAFWFCIDPVQIDRRLMMLNEEAEDSEKVDLDIDKLFANVNSALKLMGNKAGVPTALIVTKSDLVPRDADIYSSQPLQPDDLLEDMKYLKLDRLEQQSDKVRNYLKSDNVKDIMPNLSTMFDHINYFAVAAYGTVVGADMECLRAPSNIMLPFLWTLSVFGHLKPVKYESHMVKKGWLGRQVSLEGKYEIVGQEELFYSK